MRKRKYLPEAIIFDIDGTLLDVRPSFYSTIIKASEIWWKLIERKVPPFEPDLTLIEGFKRLPGFNDDWEVAISVILIQKWLLEKGASLEGQSPKAILHFLKPHGLRDLERQTGKLLTKDQKEQIKKICMEIYAGKECRLIYGFEPSTWKKEGLWKKERPILNISDLKKRFKIAFYTGRNTQETLLALKLLNFKLSRNYIITSDDFKKPDPRGLFKLLHELSANHAVFVGDSEDDRITALNYKRFFRYPLIDFINIRDIIEIEPSSRQTESPLWEPLPEIRLISFLDGRKRSCVEQQERYKN